MSYDQPRWNRCEVVVTGKVEILIDEFIDLSTEEASNEVSRYTITVKQGTEVVQEFIVMADEIELVRL